MLLGKGFRLLPLLLCLLLVLPLLHSSLSSSAPLSLFRSPRHIFRFMCGSREQQWSETGAAAADRGCNGGSGERRGHKSSARQKRDPSHRWKGERKSGREGGSLSCVVVMVMVDLGCIVSRWILDVCLTRWASRCDSHKVSVQFFRGSSIGCSCIISVIGRSRKRQCLLIGMIRCKSSAFKVYFHEK